MQRSIFHLFTVLIFVITYPAGGSAQSIWTAQYPGEHSVTLEIMKPNFSGRSNFSFATSVLFLSTSIPLSDQTNIVLDLPFSHAGSSRSSDNTVGNPYVGIELGAQNARVYPEFGVRLPVLTSFGDRGSSVGVGRFSDFDRFEAFTPDIFSISGMLNYQQRVDSGLTLRLRGGPILSIDPSGGSSEWILAYSAQAWYQGQQIRIGAGISGRAFLTNGDDSIGERMVDQLGFTATLISGEYQPGIHIRVPIDDNLGRLLDVVIGIQISRLIK